MIERLTQCFGLSVLTAGIVILHPFNKKNLGRNIKWMSFMVNTLFMTSVTTLVRAKKSLYLGRSKVVTDVIKSVFTIKLIHFIFLPKFFLFKGCKMTIPAVRTDNPKHCVNLSIISTNHTTFYGR